VALDVNGSGRLFIKSQITDYTLRGEALSTSNVMEFFVNTYEADIDKKSRQREKVAALVPDDQTDLMRGPKRHCRDCPVSRCVELLIVVLTLDSYLSLCRLVLAY